MRAKYVVSVCVILLLALFIHHLRMDFSLLDPRQESWLWQTDWAVEYLGWLFFRYQDWEWPLGFLPNYIFPFGASIGTTDSVPLAAYFFKVFSPLLGEPFQYFSWWYLLSLFLMGLLSFQFLYRRSSHVSYSLVACAFFMIAPPLMGRNHHMALSAQWILIAALYLYDLAAAKAFKLRESLVLLVLFVVASSLHPYLWAMFVAMSSSLLFVLPWGRALSLLGVGLALSIATLTAHGYFRIGDTTNSGFGYYSADLLSFFHPHDLPVLLPNLPRGEGQYEGYAYLGLGAILLLLWAFVLKLQHKSEGVFSKRYLPLCLVLLLMWIFALATPITLAGRPLIYLDWIYKPLGFVSNTFRSSGRFVWPLYYGLLLWALTVFYQRFRFRRPELILGGLLALQFVDVRRIVDYPRSPDILYNQEVLARVEAFATGKDIAHLVVAFSNENELCPRQSFHWSHWYYYPLMAMAARKGWTVNIGSASRFPWTKYWEYCESTFKDLQSGKVGDKILYAFRPEALPHFSKALAQLDCEREEDIAFCSKP
jgi:hypothetical protein